MGTHFSAPTFPAARKEHRCIACHTIIPVGERYVMQSGHHEDRAFRNRFHDECWNFLCDEGDFEFEPGSIDPPQRLSATQAGAK